MGERAYADFEEDSRDLTCCPAVWRSTITFVWFRATLHKFAALLCLYQGTPLKAAGYSVPFKHNCLVYRLISTSSIKNVFCGRGQVLIESIFLLGVFVLMQFLSLLT